MRLSTWQNTQHICKRITKYLASSWRFRIKTCGCKIGKNYICDNG